MTENPKWLMRRALRLAEKAKGWTLPNPMVGALLVKKGRIIGEAYHHAYGAAHAEIEALKNCVENPKGASLYVTLEPCCHYGNTPPCVDAIIESGIQRVKVAVKDPSKKVSGQGLEKLRVAGLEVELGILEKEARILNREFFCFHEKNRPWFTIKAALSLDGKISHHRTEETPLTGEAVRKQVHLLRHHHQAILVGAGTVLTDDPHLGVRELEGRDPFRIVLKGKRKLPQSLQVFRNKDVLVLKDLNPQKITEVLMEKNFISVLVEGGQEVFKEFIKTGLVDEFQFFCSPQILGKEALDFYEDRLSLDILKVRKLGPDLWITAKPQWVHA